MPLQHLHTSQGPVSILARPTANRILAALPADVTDPSHRPIAPAACFV